ncbi:MULTISPECIES: methyltransferase domain-containing protein [unclassified Streptomyces]|uniref:methyltransferase domain-containing protein n=1 Tax=unclassified Streptomyces TaxID=2593676 RepID=UPI0022B6125E|nr:MULTISPECIES: methyltransferase domain-containing protein [unclassified Streptomyces]MCZ7415068.1 methyltransferase domain-containing protein [Streptomyces sp. WMMC897]MCZ7432011.1 methyltransferase domain-containing protein [Streptomyces sp. WMMC1477]
MNSSTRQSEDVRGKLRLCRRERSSTTAEAENRAPPDFASKAHLSAAYSDQTLVTRVGPTHADEARPDEKPTGSPTSSSTLPGLIVSMLHRLDARPGHKVLDVGTGSGYSAALMGHRLGDENVTSVDVDGYLVQAARARLAEFGRNPRMEAIDATGELPEPGYDRIMATVSVRPVPKTWLHALRPGGRLVTTIAHTALLITADMGDDGIARGNVQSDPATFMGTRRGADYPPKLNEVFATAREDEGDEVRAADGPLPDLWQEWPLRWLYELGTPGVETRAATYPDGQRCVWLLSADGSWSRAEQPESGPGRVHQGGARRLWDDLERVRRKWEEGNHFPLHSMTAELSPDGSHLVAPGGAWRFAI